jgi:hypothetical protein
VTTSASLRGEIFLLAEKRITLSFGSTNLFDSYLTVVSLHALHPPVLRRAAGVVMTDLTRVEVILSTTPRLVEELLS